MGYQLKYETLNPGQYPEHHVLLQQRADDGWRVAAASLNYNEISILWERNPDGEADRTVPEPEVPAAEGEAPSP